MHSCTIHFSFLEWPSMLNVKGLIFLFFYTFTQNVIVTFRSVLRARAKYARTRAHTTEEINRQRNGRKIRTRPSLHWMMSCERFVLTMGHLVRELFGRTV